MKKTTLTSWTSVSKLKSDGSLVWRCVHNRVDVDATTAPPIPSLSRSTHRSVCVCPVVSCCVCQMSYAARGGATAGPQGLLHEYDSIVGAWVLDRTRSVAQMSNWCVVSSRCRVCSKRRQNGRWIEVTTHKDVQYRQLMSTIAQPSASGALQLRLVPRPKVPFMMLPVLVLLVAGCCQE